MNLFQYKVSKRLLSAVFFICVFTNSLSAKPKKLVVAKDGSGDFSTVTEAILSVPDHNPNTIVIYIKKGIY